MIVVNGDSFVHEYHLPEEQRWSKGIGADLNLALGGGSNDRTFQTTIECLNNKDVKTLILGWTRWERTYFNKANGSRYKIVSDSAIDEFLGDSHDDKDVVEFYYNKVFNEYTQLKNMLIHMLHIQDYCRLKKIKLINFATVFGKHDLSTTELTKIAKSAYMSKETKDMEQMGIKYNQGILSDYILRLDPDTWVDREVFASMKQKLKDFPTVDLMGHIGIDGSKRWAEILKEQINR